LRAIEIRCLLKGKRAAEVCAWLLTTTNFPLSKERALAPVARVFFFSFGGDMNRFIQGIQHFQSAVYPERRDLFQRLATGQTPEALFIACSDSRVALELLTQTGPGDIFVCRNAGNIAPVHGQNDAVSGAIEYAVSALKVKDIVVKGHSDCGAMKGLLNPAALAEMPVVAGWLKNAEEARLSLDAAGIDPQAPEALETITKLNIRLQLEHLCTHPSVRDALRAGNLQLHGWYYRIDTGVVEAWDADRDTWSPVTESYAPISARHKPLEQALHA
jgi:carbonic anhydrase